MTSAAAVGDLSLRQQALDPVRSFIVQAPAGSGKTELLIQRYLRLLATVDEPEEILAVTFTRKAAGEMRSRVIGALQLAAGTSPPEPPHLACSWSLARALLDDPQRRDWQLLRHPARLRISTIDSVNQWLARRSPLLGGTGVLGQTSDMPEPFYRDAARRTLQWLAEEDTEEAGHVRALLQHLDNDAGRLENLLIDMLSRRDQWLHPVLVADGDRERMEQPLHALTSHHLQLLDGCLDDGLKSRMAVLLSFAARARQANNRAAGPWLEQQGFPDTATRNLPLWQTLVDALLTTSGDTFRRKLTVTEGFPPGCAEKTRMMAVIEDCAKHPDLRERLIEVRRLPGNGYAAGQWQVLQHLLAVLKLAAAELRLVFAACGRCDFSAVASAALTALGDAQEPSSLGLALDYRIRHILVDEFQDTSLSQFELLGRLTAGWEEGDGRTVFLVGDPMQSIYRFRHAEVGVFMRVRDAGLGALRPEFLQLTANFRSAPPLVAWFNHVFGRTFPRHDDALHGTVRYTPGESRSRSSSVPALVDVRWLLEDEDEEAAQVIDLARAALAEAPDERVCILVRSRAHAAHILKAMRRAGLSFVAPDIENLELSAVAQELLALTRALLHPADRLAWIGVLRAPWCGLSLVDLHALIGSDPERPVAEWLAMAGDHPSLDSDTRKVLARLCAVMQRAAAARGRRPLRDLVEGAWLELGGPATLREEAELETAHGFFAVLEAADAGGDCSDVLALAGQLRNRKGSLGSGRAPVAIMTMHKAKGLEFDTVILPGLSRPARHDAPPLLAWQTVPIGAGRAAVILAPLQAAGGNEDPLYRYLQELERGKRTAEVDRLLYVACTRARRRLHLIARLDARLDEESGALTLHRPAANTLLAHLWEALRGEAESALPRLVPPAAGADADVIWVQPLIRRLPAGWVMPPCPPPVQAAAGLATQAAAPALVYEWASRWAMLAGSVVHRWLQIIAEQGLHRYDAATLEGLWPLWQRQLAALGAQGGEIEQATSRVMQALRATLADPRGRWILGGHHADAACELALTVNQGGRCRRIVIDRTLVGADGIRWLIDYKTSTHEGGDMEAFIALECERHRAQLSLYREALSAIDSLPVRSALYFPLLGVFRELDLDAAP